MSASLVREGFVSPHALAGVSPDAAVLVAFSGGPDSRTLLHLLVSDAAQKGYRLYAVHVNHGIRGAEADRDEAFCQSVADGYGIPLFIHHADVPTLAEQTGQSIETAAREARYACFEELLAKHDIPLLVTAHNADDNLETVMFDLLRGCGLDGLCGIPPVRPLKNGTLTRPLLSVDREAILEFCREHALDYVTDSTNTDTQYTRNRIRAELIPALRAMDPSVTERVTRTCNALRADAEHLREEAEALLAWHRQGFSLPITSICDTPRAIAARALMLLFREFTNGIALEQCHVQALLSLCEQARPHSSISLPDGRVATIENGRLCLETGQPKATPTVDYCIPLCEGHHEISQADCEIVMGTSQNAKNIYKKAIRMYFASDKIMGSIVVRNRRSGDKILMGGMHRDVRKLLCEKKIPLTWRNRLPLICDENGILAIPFVAMRDGICVSPEQDGACTITLYFHNYE